MSSPIEIPHSPWTTALVLAIAPILYLAWRTLRRGEFPSSAVAVATPGLALAFWLVGCHTIGYASGSFRWGLWLGTTLPALLGCALYAASWRGRRPERILPRLTLDADTRWMLLGAGVTTALVSPFAFGWMFHDEVYLQGHQAIAAQIQNGIYPPRNLSFGEVELRYHYGFNTWTAAIGAVLRVPIPLAIDLATLVSWFLCWCLVWRLGQRLAGVRLGAVAAPLVLFSGGIPALCDTAVPDCTYCPGVSWCGVDGALINPPVLSYFFQHPWTLGLPLGLTAVLLYGSRPRVTAAYFVATGGLLLALAWSQFVFFLCTLGALWAAEAWTRAPDRGRAWWGATSTAGIVLALASVTGAWFARGAGEGLGVVFSPGVTETAGGTLRWLLATHGVVLLGGWSGFRHHPDRSAPVAIWVLGSLAVVMLFAHAHTWDIVKFSLVAQLGLTLGLGVTLVHWVNTSRERWRVMAAAAVCLLCVGSSLSFGWALFQAGDTELRFPRHAKVLSEHDAAAVSWLRPRVAPGELVVRTALDAALGYAQWGGLPQVWMDGQLARVRAFGITTDRIAQRQRLLVSWPAQMAPYAAESVRWLVLGPNDARLLAHTRAWEAEGRARERARFGALRVFEIAPEAFSEPAPPLHVAAGVAPPARGR
ncbi:MAG: hypothetical protein AAF430_16295 [Myxococcota bacterium]